MPLRLLELAHTREFRELLLRRPKIADSVADGAVRCVLLSASNSLIIRENTGNFRDFGRLEIELGPNKPCLLSGFCRNSLANRTGNYFGGTGKFFGITGNFQAEQGYSSGGRRGPKILCFRRGWRFEEAQERITASKRISVFSPSPVNKPGAKRNFRSCPKTF